MSKFGFLTPKPKPRKSNTTSAQRTYGKGRGRGLRTGRAEGALAGGAAVGFTVAALNNMTLKELKKKEKDFLKLYQEVT